jgi:hypothetical protein
MIYDNVGNMTNQIDHKKGLEKDILNDSNNRIQEVNDSVGNRVGRYWCNANASLHRRIYY